MKKILFLTLLFLLSFRLCADEGMWVPLLLQARQADMTKLGMKITTKDIYDINNVSLKDAIVQFGPGCTGEFVSNKGLLFTNHHCGYKQIVEHSTVEHDYLTNGFWAMDISQELPCPGLKATLLVRMEDVTKEVLQNVTDSMSAADRKKIIDQNIEQIQKKATENTHYKAQITPFYYGNQYFMFVNEVFEDVRLVGAPPSNIGKFGGDTDNWMWPRHTGDFSIFRVYTSADNKPAPYSKGNVPYKPKKHLPISVKGISENDFTFVFGYPGRTQEYILSDAIDFTVNTYNPVRIELRQKRLDIYNAAMRNSAEERLMYSSQVASIANFWKKMIGENKGIKQLNGIEKKRAFEEKFQEWAEKSPARKKYISVQAELSKIYNQVRNIELSRIYYSEALMASDIMLNAQLMKTLDAACHNKPSDDKEIDTLANNFYTKLKSYFSDKFNLRKPVDREIFRETMHIYYTKIDKPLLPPAFSIVDSKYKGNFDDFVNDIFDKSFLTSPEAAEKIFRHFRRGDFEKIEKDPAYAFFSEVLEYINRVYPLDEMKKLYADANELYQIYMQGMMEMQPKRDFYPDANSTLRISYGKVKGFTPVDGVEYKYYTTIEGIMQKENPNIYDYMVMPKLKTLYNDKDYGRYADRKGYMPVAFIATNHTTGGNSGSPVLNASGELIGINFDRCWESTMSDLMYDPDFCRNITLDIRYCLFIIDKYAQAQNLIKEMTIR